jgi:hypothetical protein
MLHKYEELGDHIKNLEMFLQITFLGVKVCQNEKNKNKRDYFVTIFSLFKKHCQNYAPNFIYLFHVWIMISNRQHFKN